MKNKTFALLALALVWLGITSTARAGNESIGLSLEAEPIAGPLFKEVARPLDASLTITVTNPPAETKITPLKVANVTFPQDMDFYPNEEKAPACEELSERSNLAAGVVGVVKLCPKSVIGTGTAVVQIGQNKGAEPFPTVVDPQLVIFNAGRSPEGRPRILIYGFSPSVNAGLLMRGTLAENGELKINIGVLPFDSSVSRFTLGIPGEQLETDDDESPGGTMTVRGLDPGYLRGKCSNGTWRATGAFELGTRSDPGGEPISETTFLSSNPFDLACEGLAGRPKLKIGRISGPKRISPGRSGKYVLRVRNVGTATAKPLTVKASGAAKGGLSGLRLSPGQTRNIAVRVRAKARRISGRIRFRLTVNGMVYKESVRKVRVG